MTERARPENSPQELNKQLNMCLELLPPSIFSLDPEERAGAYQRRTLSPTNLNLLMKFEKIMASSPLLDMVQQLLMYDYRFLLDTGVNKKRLSQWVFFPTFGLKI